MKPTREKAPSPCVESELLSLAHYSNLKPSRTTPRGSDTESADEDECQRMYNEEDSDNGSQRYINPFMDIDATQVNAQVSKSLDFASDSDSDIEEAVLDMATLEQNLINSSSDEYYDGFDDDDPLRHAEVFTEEEIVTTAKNKMERLKTLFIDQVKRLQYILEKKRHLYLVGLKKEKELYSNIHTQPRTTSKEEKVYQKLKALNRYHKRNGVEAVLRKKSLEKRSKIMNGRKGSLGNKCIFAEEGVKCGAKVLPLSKYCLKHILEDQNQALFRVCSSRCDELPCREPISVFLENSYCVFHNMHIPPLPHTNLTVKEEKES